MNKKKNHTLSTLVCSLCFCTKRNAHNYTKQRKHLCPLSLCRHLLLWSAQHQEKRLHRFTPEHAGLWLHTGTARPVTSDDEGQHVTDQLVQQGALQVPHQCLPTNKTRYTLSLCDMNLIHIRKPFDRSQNYVTVKKLS